jgi:hypothetical protein
MEPKKIDILFEQIKKDGPNKDAVMPHFRDPDYRQKLDMCSIEHERRDLFVNKYSWAVPSKEAIQKMVTFIGTDKCVETGAGSGLWSHLLQLSGVDIIATDDKSEKCKSYYTTVEKLTDIEAITKYQDRNVLFLCWSRTDPVPRFTGNKVIYIGESESGCTDGIPNETEWKLQEQVQIPCWWGVHDYLELYVRK